MSSFTTLSFDSLLLIFAFSKMANTMPGTQWALDKYPVNLNFPSALSGKIVYYKGLWLKYSYLITQGIGRIFFNTVKQGGAE